VIGIGMLLYHALWVSVLGQMVCVALAILAGLVALVVYAAAAITIYGISAVFQQSYAAYFFAGRYLELGERLEPPPLVEASTGVAPPPRSDPRIPLEDAPPVW
jgi:hypothetical protein